LWLVQAVVIGSLCAMLWFLVVATLVDLEHLIIPDELSKSFQFAAPFLALVTTTNTAFGWDVGGWLVSQDLFGVVTVQPGVFLGRVLGLIGGALILLLLTLPLAKWIYSSFCPESERWRAEDHRGFRVGVVWYVIVTTVTGGILVVLVAVDAPMAAGLGQALLGSLAGWWSLYAVGLLGTMAFRRNAMGFGDVKFLAPIGAFLGPLGVIYAFLGAATVGAVIGLPLYLMTKRSQIPFGPYLALGSVVALIIGPQVHQWIFAGLLRGI
jgi:prepilin signal peptidase PulO-like enzyme (type II secretory pathway)